MKKFIPIICIMLLNSIMANAQTPDSINISKEINKIESVFEIIISYNNTHIIEKYSYFKHQYWYNSTDIFEKTVDHLNYNFTTFKFPTNTISSTCDSLLQIIRYSKFKVLLSKMTKDSDKEEFYDKYLLESTFHKKHINPMFAKETFCEFNLEKIAIEMAPMYQKIKEELIQLEQVKVDSLNSNRQLITKAYVQEYVLNKSRHQHNPTILCLLLTEKLNFILSSHNEIIQFNELFTGSYKYKNVEQSFIKEAWSAIENTKIRNSLYRAIKRTFKKLYNKSNL